jgi:hypothetical protein
VADLFNDAFDSGKNREPLHPVVQMRFGIAVGRKIEVSSSARIEDPSDSFIITIPPEYLQEFTFISRRGGIDRMTLTFVDPTYGDVEAELFKLDKDAKNNASKKQRDKKALLVRWGYPGNGLEEATWHSFEIFNIAPTINHTGIRLSVEGAATGAAHATIAEPTVYTGKISSVVRKIAQEMGFDKENIFIEETADEENETRKTPWHSGNRTRIDILNDLLLYAVSKSSPQGNYSFRISSNGAFHYHTPLFKTPKQKRKGTSQPQKKKTTDDKNKRTYRRFNVLFGKPNGVADFQPRYTASTIGSFARQCIATTVDPRSKQFQQRTVDRRTMGMSTDHDSKGAKTSQAPLTKSKDAATQRRKSNSFASVPTKSVGLGGRCAGQTTQQNTSPDHALAKIENAWKALQRSLGGCTLTLHGLPEYADLDADEDYIDIAVVLPVDAENLGGRNLLSRTAAGTNRRGGIHWSSGRYNIKEVTHSITTGYMITVECMIPTQLEGPFVAKTGAPEKKAPSKIIDTSTKSVVDLLVPPTDSNASPPVDPNDPLKGLDI